MFWKSKSASHNAYHFRNFTNDKWQVIISINVYIASCRTISKTENQKRNRDVEQKTWLAHCRCTSVSIWWRRLFFKIMKNVRHSTIRHTNILLLSQAYKNDLYFFRMFVLIWERNRSMETNYWNFLNSCIFFYVDSSQCFHFYFSISHGNR